MPSYFIYDKIAQRFIKEADSSLKAMILAAGYGRRLEPLTCLRPKPLIPFVNKPVIEYTFEFLKRHNIREVVINTHHLANVITDYIGDGARYGMNIIYSYEPEILGTAGGIKAVEKILCDDTFIVINGDIIFDINMEGALAFHKDRKAKATLLLREDVNASAYGIIKVDKYGQIQKFLDTAISMKTERLLSAMFTGIHILEPSVFDFIPPRKFCGVTEDVYPEILKKNGLFGYITTGYWSDIGHHKHYLKAHMDVIDEKYRLIGKTNRSCKTIIGEICLIGDKAEIGPYTVTGNRCAIDDNSVVKGSVLWDNVNIKNSSLFNCIAGSNAVIENMKIENMVVTEREDKVYITPMLFV